MITFSVLYELGNAFIFQCNCHLVNEEGHKVLGITSDAARTIELFIHIYFNQQKEYELQQNFQSADIRYVQGHLDLHS